VERKLRSLAKGSRVQAFRVAVHPRILAMLAGPGGSRLAAIEDASRRRFFLVPAAENGHVHLDHFEVLEQGKLEALMPSSSIEEGASIQLKLVEVGLHEPAAGVGKVDGRDVVVADAAKLVGKKVAVTIGRVLDGMAYATLADDAAALTPITFEAEAERPTRAGSRVAKKELPEADIDAAAASVETVSEGDEAPAEEQPRKKRARRGTRGGRGRKKPAAATAAANADAAPDGRKTTPRIHVPPPDLIPDSTLPAAAAVREAPDMVPETEVEVDLEADAEAAADGQPKRKRTRRGTRGGRRRRKTPAHGETGEASEGGVATVEEPPAGEYVPMSEWLDDFDPRSTKT
jgi:predicted RNA-binding protein with TRAM domain